MLVGYIGIGKKDRDLDSRAKISFPGSGCRITHHANDRSWPMAAVTGDRTVRGGRLLMPQGYSRSIRRP